MRILSTALGGAKNQVNLIGAPSFAQVNPYGLYGHYKSDEYASHYPNIRPITNELMGIRPHAIDANGKPVSHPALDALYHPNKRDSLPLFMEKLGVSVLAQDYTYLLVWRREGGETYPGGDYGTGGQRIGGYTFLENPAVEYRDGRIYYKMGAQEFDEDEVIAIPGGAHPHRLYEGYSPYLAAAKWATLDSYIADYQKGFFENGAVPAGMFKVVAATTQEYNDMVDKLQERHRGAGNNNNVSYSHVPVDLTGKPQQSQIEWVPFAQTNREIDFEPLLNHVDERLSESYGVSAIIKGVDSQATYNNAEVSENGFMKRAVKPLALRIFSQITHELNRITGGLGVAITFDLDIPAISEAEKVKADTKMTEGDIILKYTSEPYNWSLDSVVDAFDLPERYKLLKRGTDVAVIENDKPEVDEGGEVESSPDPSKIDGVTPLNKAKGAAKSTRPKAQSDYPEIDQELVPYELQIEAILQAQIDRQVKRAIDSIQDQYEAEDEENERMAQEIATILIALAIVRGEKSYAEGIRQARDAGLDVDNLPDYVAEFDELARQQEYVTGFNEETTNNIAALITAGVAAGLTVEAIREQLRSFADTQQFRLFRYSQNESWSISERAEQQAYEQLAMGLAAGTAFEIVKTWNTQEDDRVCPICQPLDKITVALGEVFPGGVSTPPIHILCRCKVTRSIRAVSVQARSLHCKDCDRFLGTTTQDSYSDKIKCANSKCRALEVPVLKEVSVTA